MLILIKMECGSAYYSPARFETVAINSDLISSITKPTTQARGIKSIITMSNGEKFDCDEKPKELFDRVLDLGDVLPFPLERCV